MGIVPKNVIDKLDKIHTNAGVIYIKFSPENMEIVDEYKQLVTNEGIEWMVDQNMLNVLLTKNKDKLKIAGMSDEFISKFGSILRHFRGNNKEAKYNEYRDILKDIR